QPGEKDRDQSGLAGFPLTGEDGDGARGEIALPEPHGGVVAGGGQGFEAPANSGGAGGGGRGGRSGRRGGPKRRFFGQRSFLLEHVPIGARESHCAQLTLVTRQCHPLSVSATGALANGAGGGFVSRRANAFCRLWERSLAPWRDWRCLVVARLE